MVVYEQALLALDRDDKPRPTPQSSRGSTTEAAEQRVERPSVSSDLGPNCEEILAGRPFYLRAGMSVSTAGMKRLQEVSLVRGHAGGAVGRCARAVACCGGPIVADFMGISGPPRW